MRSGTRALHKYVCATLATSWCTTIVNKFWPSSYKLVHDDNKYQNLTFCFFQSLWWMSCYYGTG